MAVVETTITKELVRTFAGILDFYFVKDQCRVRAWPKILQRQQTTAEKASATRFGQASASSKLLSETVVYQWKLLAQSTIYTWRDLYIRAHVQSSRTDAQLQASVKCRRNMYYG